MEEELDAEPPGRRRERIREDEVRVAAVRLAEGCGGIQPCGPERRREGADGTLRRSDVAVRGRRGAGEEVAVGDERRRRDDDRREERRRAGEPGRSHRKSGSFRQPHLCIL